MKRLFIVFFFLLSIGLGVYTVVPAYWEPDFQRGVDAYDNKDYPSAMREFKPLAKEGHLEAMFNVALMYAKGQGGSQNYKEAEDWYRRSAEQGYLYSQYNLGALYDRGDGLPRDFKLAVKWYSLAAEQGDVSAQADLGRLYFSTRDPKNLGSAAKWLLKAAEQGHDTSQASIAYMYQVRPRSIISWPQIRATKGRRKLWCVWERQSLNFLRKA